jgi:hypothetical protein
MPDICNDQLKVRQVVRLTPRVEIAAVVRQKQGYMFNLLIL